MVNDDITTTFPNQNDRSRSTGRSQSIVIIALMILVLSSFIHDIGMLENTKQQQLTTTISQETAKANGTKTPPTMKGDDDDDDDDKMKQLQQNEIEHFVKEGDTTTTTTTTTLKWSYDIQVGTSDQPAANTSGGDAAAPPPPLSANTTVYDNTNNDLDLAKEDTTTIKLKNSSYDIQVVTSDQPSNGDGGDVADGASSPPPPPPPHSSSSSNTIVYYDNTNRKQFHRKGGLLRNELPLTYPFHIIQFGVPRSGSTFQYELLKAIIYLKSPPEEQQIYREMIPSSRQNYNLMKNKYDKTHNFNVVKQFLNDYNNATTTTSSSISSTSSIFTSSTKLSDLRNQFIKTVNITTTTAATNNNVTAFNEYIIDIPPSSSSSSSSSSKTYHIMQYNQQVSNLYNCSLCEINNYIPIFNLTQTEVILLKEYMSYFQDLRQCCGMQMSKYNFYRLHNCNMTEYQQLKQYPWCELKNLTHIEYKMSNHSIPHKPKISELHLLWTKQGDCFKYDTKIIQQNLAFNNRQFNGCPPITTTSLKKQNKNEERGESKKKW